MDRKQGYYSENDHLLDQLLKEEPDYVLSDDFADRLVKKIEIYQTFKQNILEFLTILGVVIAIVIAFGGIYYFMDKENFPTLTAVFFNGYAPVFALFGLFILFMDKVMLRLLNQLRE